VSTDPKWAGDGAVSSEPHTDPMLPVITDDMLPPLANPRVPTLDDRTLAQLLAELEGEENALLGADPGLGAGLDPDDDTDPLDPVEALERARPKGPVRALGGPPALPSGPSALPPGPSASAQPPAVSKAPPAPPPAQPRPTQPPPVRPRPTQPPMDEPDPGSRYGDYRPPVGGVQDEVPSLIGLTRRSQSKLGSRLFTIAFVAIFVLIVIQTIASVVSAGH
jgi:hypothetical protein